MSSETLIQKAASVPVTMPGSVLLTDGTGADEIVLLLHGYGQTAAHFFSEIQEAVVGHSVCVLQAPFPVPIKNSFEIGYAWYAYDMKTKVFHIPISSAVEFAVGVLDQLGLTSKVTRVVGFSQGAYVTPFIGLRLPRVRQVISVNGRFKHEDLSDSKIPFRMDAINGEQDDIVDPVLARQSHHSLMDRGVRGTFNLIPKGTHRFSKDFAVVLAKLLLE